MANFDDLKIEIDGPKKKAFPESILTGAFCKKRGLKWSNLACVVSTRVSHAYAEYAVHADYAHMQNMRMQMKISSILSTYRYLPKIAIFWVKNGSAWLCFQF